MLVAGALLALGYLLGNYNNGHLHRDQRTVLLAAGNTLSQHFNANLQHAIDGIQATAWLLDVHHDVDRAAFLRFAEHVLQANPEIRELRWSPRVRDADRPGFIAKVRAQGLANFDLTEEKPESGKRTVAARRAEYFPVLYAAPLQDAPLGFDSYSLTDDRWAMHGALEQGRPFAASVVTQAHQARTMRIHIPVFAPSDGDETTAGAANLVGFVTGVVTLDDMFAKLQQEVAEMDADLLLFDNTNKTEQLLAYLPGKHGRVTADEATTEYRILRKGYSLPVAVAGRQWVFVMQPRGTPFSGDMLYVGMLLVSLLLIGVLMIWLLRGGMDRVSRD